MILRIGFYDYDRTDDQGKTRELHIQQSIDVTTVPAKDPDLSIQQENQGQSSIVTYVKKQISLMSMSGVSVGF